MPLYGRCYLIRCHRSIHEQYDNLQSQISVANLCINILTKINIALTLLTRPVLHSCPSHAPPPGARRAASAARSWSTRLRSTSCGASLPTRTQCSTSWAGSSARASSRAYSRCCCEWREGGRDGEWDYGSEILLIHLIRLSKCGITMLFQITCLLCQSNGGRSS